jgi:hypothetical protein
VFSCSPFGSFYPRMICNIWHWMACQQGGKVLIPAFALGRAQELLLILDEYWEAHPELQHIPLYYASHLAKTAMTVYQTYINSMNERVQKQFEVHFSGTTCLGSRAIAVESVLPDSSFRYLVSMSLLYNCSRLLSFCYCRNLEDIILSDMCIIRCLCKFMLLESRSQTPSTSSTFST